jgi:hypothetical protein
MGRQVRLLHHQVPGFAVPPEAPRDLGCPLATRGEHQPDHVTRGPRRTPASVGDHVAIPHPDPEPAHPEKGDPGRVIGGRRHRHATGTNAPGGQPEHDRRRHPNGMVSTLDPLRSRSSDGGRGRRGGRRRHDHRRRRRRLTGSLERVRELLPDASAEAIHATSRTPRDHRDRQQAREQYHPGPTHRSSAPPTGGFASCPGTSCRFRRRSDRSR